MDLEMPVLNGYEATTVIRQQLKNNVPIIAITTHSLPGERKKCLQGGMNDYISKSVREDHLFSAIYNLTCSHKMNIENTATTISPGSFAHTEKICNLDYLMKVTHGNKEKVNDILAVFLEETPAELSALTAAIDKTNYTVICNILHNIKTSFSILGISSLGPLINEMRDLGSIASGIKKIKLLNRKVNFVFGLAAEEMRTEKLKPLIAI
jgi:CheY-like chemotaxis protein